MDVRKCAGCRARGRAQRHRAGVVADPARARLKEITDGGYLELANEFEVAVGGEVFPHSHPTHEFYFVMTGEGIMTISGQERPVVPGDLIQIPPDEVHSLRPTGDEPIHCFCFAVGVKDAGPIDYTTH